MLISDDKFTDKSYIALPDLLYILKKNLLMLIALFLVFLSCLLYFQSKKKPIYQFQSLVRPHVYADGEVRIPSLETLMTFRNLESGLSLKMFNKDHRKTIFTTPNIKHLRSSDILINSFGPQSLQEDVREVHATPIKIFISLIKKEIEDEIVLLQAKKELYEEELLQDPDKKTVQKLMRDEITVGSDGFLNTIQYLSFHRSVFLIEENIIETKLKIAILSHLLKKPLDIIYLAKMSATPISPSKQKVVLLSVIVSTFLSILFLFLFLGLKNLFYSLKDKN